MADLYDRIEARPLLDAGWTPERPIAGVPRWRDPLTGGTFAQFRALERQAERDSDGETEEAA